MTEHPLSRRSFLSRSAALTGTAALSASSYARVRGAGERIGVGFIGYGLIGKRHVIDFQAQKDVDPVGVAEVHRGRLAEATAFIGGGTKGYHDFRKLLDNKDVDAVVVSTPDHWHALMTMLACAAGKDVYVEKPLTLFVREGRWMIEVAAKHKRIVQVGTQQRSGEHYRRARELIGKGHLGKISSVRMVAARNIMPGYGSPPDGEPPADLDYELWLGPAPRRKYNPNRAIYHFRWFWDYSGGQMTNLGQHSLDIVDWALGPLALRSVCSIGGRFCLEDNGETPDTQDALFEFPGWTAAWSHREASGGEEPKYPLTFYGTNGSLGISRSGFAVEPDRDIPPANTVPQFTGAHPVGGPRPVPMEGKPKLRCKAIEDRTGNGRAQFREHVRNFLDCVKSRKTPVSDLESGHRVATLCHLANLSLRLGRKLRWDGKKETIVGDADAARRLERPYRAPWDRERKALGVGG
jgi:predicted dehydrogenase